MATPVRTALTTSSSKTSQSSVSTASVTVNAGEMLVVMAAYDDEVLNSVTWNGINLTLLTPQLGAGVRTRIAYLLVTSTASSTVTFNWANAIVAKAWAVSKLTNVTEVDVETGATGTSTAPSSGNFTTTHPISALMGVVGTEGPSGDTAGTWSNSFTAGNRSGTTGNPAAGNVTAAEGFRIVTTGTLTTAAAKTGMTSRDWGAAAAAFVLRNRGFAQAQAKIALPPAPSFAQAQGNIKKTYTGNAQAQGYIGQRIYTDWTLADNTGFKNVSGNAPHSITFGNGYWALVTSSSEIAYNTDPPTGPWTITDASTLLGGSQPVCMNFGGDYFVIGTYTQGTGRIAYAYKTPVGGFTENVSARSLTFDVRSIAYGNGYWVGVGGSGQAVYTTDPTGTWTIVDVGFGTSNIQRVWYADNIWVIAGNNGKLATATDPTGTWTMNAAVPWLSTETIGDVKHANGLWVAVGATNNAKSAWATDPTGTWTQGDTLTTNPAQFIQGPYLAYGNYGNDGGIWISIGQNDSSLHERITVARHPELPGGWSNDIGAHNFLDSGLYGHPESVWYAQGYWLVGGTQTNTGTYVFQYNQNPIGNFFTPAAQARAVITVGASTVKAPAQAQARIGPTTYERILRGIAGLQSFWTLGESSGSTSIGDKVGAVTGTVNGTPTFGVASPNPQQLEPGVLLNSSYLTFGDNYDFAGSPFSIFMWIKHTGNWTSTGEHIITKESASSTGWKVFGTGGGGTPGLRLMANGSGLANNRLLGDTWQFVGGTYNGSSSIFTHVDNIKAGLNVISQTIVNNAADLTVGQAAYANSNAFDGAVSSIAIFNSVVSFDDFQALYTVANSGAIARPAQAQARIKKASNGFAQSQAIVVTGYAAQVNTSDPIAWWRFGEGSGNPQDSVATAHVDTIVGTPTYSIYHNLGDTNTAIAVSGATSYLRISNNTQLDVGAGPVSVEFWARRTAVGAAASMQVFGRGGNAYAVGFNTSDKFYIAKQGVATIATESTTTTDAKWHHFVGTWDGSTTATMYKDGVDVTAFVGAQTLTNVTATSYITGNGGTLGYTGEIDELAIYARVLSQAEIQQHLSAVPAVGGYAQAQATILIVVPTTTTYAQTQADIKTVSRGFSQAQTNIKSTSTTFAQSQADIKQISNRYSQSQADIKAINTGFAQAQADIKATGRGCAQTQADIKVTTNQFTQAQSSIKQTYNTFAQSQADIKSISRGVSQTQADIKQSYTQFSQSQTDILVTSQIYSQAQARILRGYNSFAQSQADVKVTSNVYSQAQSKINSFGVEGFAQSLANIKGIDLEGLGQAQAKINAFNISGFAQSQAGIKAGGQGYAQTQADIKSISNGFGQTQSDIKVTSNGFAQAQSTIKQTSTRFAQAQSDIKQTYTIFAQSQATIKATSSAFAQAISDIKAINNNTYAQAQADIKRTVNTFSQAQARILSTYNSFAQAQACILGWVFANAQADIKQIGQGYSNSQADIRATSNGYAQVVSSIKVTSKVFAQSNADIKQTYRGYAQVNADIVQAYLGYAQAQSDIKQTYTSYSQAQSDIKQITNGFGQAQADITAVANQFAQSNADIKITSQSFAQSQADILEIYQGYAQAEAAILRVYSYCAQSQADIKVTSNAYAQAQAKINAFNVIASAQALANIRGTGLGGSAQAQAKINAFGVKGVGQSKADIKQVSRGYAQAQGTIKQTYRAYSQAQGSIRQAYRYYAQAQSDILVSASNYAQAQTDIKQTYNGYAQAQVGIVQSYQNYAQSQAVILTVNTGFAQAQASIKVTSNGYGQSQGDVKQTYQGYSNALANITNISAGHGQANSDIKQTYQGYGNAEANIKASYSVFAQAQACVIGKVFAQAQGSIKQTYQGYGNSQANIKQTYIDFAQAQASIKQIGQGYAQSQSDIKVISNSYAQAQSDIKVVTDSPAQAQGRITSIINGYGQANSKIVISISTNITYAQANASILGAQNKYGQSQSSILATTNKIAQAQADIKATNTPNAQSQSRIKITSKGFAQSEAQIQKAYQAYAQAQSDILASTIKSANAQALIVTNVIVNAQAQAFVASKHGSGQAQAFIKIDHIIKAINAVDKSPLGIKITDKLKIASMASNRALDARGTDKRRINIIAKDRG